MNYLINKQIQKYCLSVFLVILSFLYSNAQDTTYNKFVVTSFGINAYKGDLNKNYSQIGEIISLGLQLNNTQYLNGRFAFVYGHAYGNNPDYTFEPAKENRQPNKFFRTRFWGFDYHLQFNFFKRKKWKAYIAQGAGFLRFQPFNKYEQPLTALSTTRMENEEYRNVTLFFPTQVGLYYFLSNNFGTGFEAGVMNPLTDYMDNISNYSDSDIRDNIAYIRLSVLIPFHIKQNN